MHKAFSQIGKINHENPLEICHALQTLKMSNIMQGETIEVLPQTLRDRLLYPPWTR